MGNKIQRAPNIAQAQTGPCFTKLSAAKKIQPRTTDISSIKYEASTSPSYKILAPKFREDGDKFPVLLSHFLFSGGLAQRMCNAVIRDSQWHFHKRSK